MSCQYSLVMLFLCGFSAALAVSEICKEELLEGTSCTIKLPTKNTNLKNTLDKSKEIKWVHLSGSGLIHWKNGRMKTNSLDGKMEEDGSLTFESVSLKNTGKYKYTVFNAEGSQIDVGEKEIKVYAKAPKPTVKISCKNGNATLTCDTGDRTDLNVSWYKEDKIIQNEINPKLLLTSAQVQENEPYSCSVVSSPVSNEQSDNVTVSCPTGESPGPHTIFGHDFWIMLSILAGSGALLLLLLCVLIICACQSCSQHKMHQKDEREFRLRNLQAPDSTKTDPNTAEISNYE
ncbi:uncharacterized protein si:ch211-132g1.6 [Onychostoma macrolepis]|nr:uncharacterized protein si:ch211-132g1.6 [Onychostoma macrolepis]